MTVNDLHEIRKLRGLGWGWARIGKHFGVHDTTVRRIADPGFAERENARKADLYKRTKAKEENVIPPKLLMLGIGNGPRPNDDILKRRDERLAKPYRSLGDEILGCPRRGESMLDKWIAEGRIP